MTTKTDPDILSKRIAEVTQPVESGTDEPAKKKIPLTWEEEELAFYEPKRVKAVEVKVREDRHSALLQKQLPLQWKAMHEVFAIRSQSINTRAGRTVIRVLSTDENRFEVRREDDQGFALQFDSQRKKVIFSGKPLGFEREYELIVQTSHDNVETTAWFSSTTLTTEHTDALTKAMLSVLMRFDQ
jgi:hypothetical protein